MIRLKSIFQHGKEKNTAPAASTAGAETKGEVSLKFTVPAFRYKGQEYKSAEVEAAAKEGDAAALELIAILAHLKSGVVAEVQESQSEGGE